jgi:hypothetical protein
MKYLIKNTSTVLMTYLLIYLYINKMIITAEIKNNFFFLGEKFFNRHLTKKETNPFYIFSSFHAVVHIVSDGQMTRSFGHFEMTPE